MRIFIGDKGNVDFDWPVKMTYQQINKFVAFMKEQFAVVEKESNENIRTERLGDKLFAKSWSSDELKLLLEAEDTERISVKLGRSWMSVDIKRGGFIPEFMIWSDSKGYNIVKGDTKKLIEEFMAEKEYDKQARRKKKKARRTELDNLISERKKLEGLLKSKDILVRCGRITPKDDKVVAETKERLIAIENAIKELEKGM